MYIAIPLILVVFLVSMWGKNLSSTDVKYSDLLNSLKQNNVSTFELNLSSRELKYQLKNSDKVLTYKVPDSQLFVNDFERL